MEERAAIEEIKKNIAAGDTEEGLEGLEEDPDL